MPDRASDATCNHSMQLLLISLGFHRRKKKKKKFWWQTHRQIASISFSSSTFHYSNQLPLSTFIFLLQIYVVKLLCTLKYLKESSKLSEQLSVLKWKHCKKCVKILQKQFHLDGKLIRTSIRQFAPIIFSNNNWLPTTIRTSFFI